MDRVDVGPTIESLLRESGLPRREADILLRSVLRRERAYLIAHPEEAVDSLLAGTAQAWFARRRSGDPLAYITGRREFYGISLRVTPDALIPRPETEQLVDLALEILPPGSPAHVLELGTGNGAIALALALQRPALKITATDVSEEALALARRNAQEHAAPVSFTRGDWFEAVGTERFDLIVSNPPYVADGDPHLAQGDARFEPRLALAGGEDGLACVRAIATMARDHLCPGASLLLEHGFDQGERCVSLLRELGYAAVADFRDLAGLPRVCSGVWGG